MMIYIETSGCAFNVSDSEAMAGVLRSEGYELAPDARSADLVILNTCTVKERSFLDFRKRLSALREESMPVVVAGCIPKAYSGSNLLSDVPSLGPDVVANVGDVVRSALAGLTPHQLNGHRAQPSRPTLPTIRRNPMIEILPIARGCRSACTFCQTRIARGRLRSFPAQDILDQARRAIATGARELWVTGQDTGAYGHDIGSSLPSLVRGLLALPGDFRVRLGMSSPEWIVKRLDEVLELFDDPKMFRFLHVPVQSGSERVLRDMRRNGTVEEFERIHSEFIARFPEGTMLTDIIAGYPTETDEDFEATLDLLRRMKLPGVNGSKFSPRPGTVAAGLKPLPSAVVTERSKRLMELVREISGTYHAERVGTRHDIIIDQAGPRGTLIGRTDAYRPVMIREFAPMGSVVKVEITHGEPFRFVGKLRMESPTPAFSNVESSHSDN